MVRFERIAPYGVAFYCLEQDDRRPISFLGCSCSEVWSYRQLWGVATATWCDRVINCTECNHVRFERTANFGVARFWLPLQDDRKLIVALNCTHNVPNWWQWTAAPDLRVKPIACCEKCNASFRRLRQRQLYLIVHSRLLLRKFRLGIGIT